MAIMVDRCNYELTIAYNTLPPLLHLVIISLLLDSKETKDVNDLALL